VIALSDPIAVTLSVGGFLLALALLAALRVIFRKEPSPPSWRRFRVGLFIERDPHDEHAREDPPSP